MLSEVYLGSQRPPEKTDTLIGEHMQIFLLVVYFYVFILFYFIFFLMNECQSPFCPEETNEEPLTSMESFYSTKGSLDY